MEWMQETFSPEQIYYLENLIGNWFFMGALAFLAVEMLWLRLKKRLSLNSVGDMATNYVTLAMFFGVNLLVGALYIAVFYACYEYFRFATIPINLWTIAACIVLADIAYYWEHRLMHRIGIGWATHTVHHSSPYFNISVAYRFGPMDGIFPIFFHIPLVLMGFHPLLVFFAEMIVQLYQTALHTEIVGKFPKPIEAIMNTPSHHRVHHGSNEVYLDKNYAGIFILWDRLFGTFAEEKEKVVYGILTPINTINPFPVFFHGLTRLNKKFWQAKGFAKKFGVLFKPPGWDPETGIEYPIPSHTSKEIS